MDAAAPDRIEIKDLLLRAIIGVNPEERGRKQDVLVNLVLFADLRPAAASDDLEGAVNYRTVAKDVIALVEESSFRTVEKLAAAIADLVLTRHPAEAVQVAVEKPGAIRFARSAGVTIFRRRGDPAP